jgi:hypothetical protein
MACGGCAFFTGCCVGATGVGFAPGTGFIGSTFVACFGFALGLVCAAAPDAESPKASALAAITTTIFLMRTEILELTARIPE